MGNKLKLGDIYVTRNSAIPAGGFSATFVGSKNYKPLKIYAKRYKPTNVQLKKDRVIIGDPVGGTQTKWKICHLNPIILLNKNREIIKYTFNDTFEKNFVRLPEVGAQVKLVKNFPCWDSIHKDNLVNKYPNMFVISTFIWEYILQHNPINATYSSSVCKISRPKVTDCDWTVKYVYWNQNHGANPLSRVVLTNSQNEMVVVFLSSIIYKD